MIKNFLNSVRDTLKLASVEPYLFLCLLGYSIRLVTFQNLLMESACRNLHLFPEDICNDLDSHKDQKEASIEAGNNLYSWVMLVSSLPAILVAIFLGPWSDKYSRKWPLGISAGGMMLEAAVSAVLCFYPKVSPIWYAVAALFAGFSGGFIMCNSAAFSYMSDVTDERSRPARYAILEFSNIFAVVVGSSLGGWVFKAGGYKYVMIMAPCAFGLSIVYTTLCLQETRKRPKDHGLSRMLGELITVQNIKESYRTCSMKRPGNIRLQIWMLVWASFSQKFVDMGTVAVSYFYSRTMYSWDVTDFSNACTAFYVVNAIVTVVLIPFLSNKLHIHEAGLGLVGMLSLIAKMVLTSVAVSEPLFFYAWFGGSLNNSAGIAIRSRLSKLVNKDELGRAFSLLGTCESVTPLLGTLAFVQIYIASQKTFPGMPYALAAVFLLPSAFIFWWMLSLPTISVGEFDMDHTLPSTSFNRNEKTEEPLEDNFSFTFTRLREDKDEKPLDEPVDEALLLRLRSREEGCFMNLC